MILGKVEATTYVINLRIAEYFGGRDAIVDNARKLLSRWFRAGSNTVIVAQGNVAREAYPVYPGEGEAIVFEPDGKGSFHYLAHIAPQDWTGIIDRLLR